MKRAVCFFVVSFGLFFLFACVDFYSLDVNGVFESEAPTMQIVFMPSDRGVYNGELYKEDGSTEKIALTVSHGHFFIWERSDDEMYGTDDDYLYKGKIRQKDENTLVLIMEDDQVITLNKIAELPFATEELYGPFTKDAYLEKSQELSVGEMCTWMNCYRNALSNTEKEAQA